MKKFLVTLTLAIVATFFAVLPAYATGIGVNVNGQNVIFDGQAPVIVGGSTFVPIRGVFEQLGFNVSWDDQVILENADNRIVIPIGSTTFTINAAVHILDNPAQIIGGSTMLPLRAVLEPLGYSLAWNADTQIITITSNLPPVAILPQPTPQPTPEPTPEPTPQPADILEYVENEEIQIIPFEREISIIPSNPHRNEEITLTFYGLPNIEYNIRIWSALNNELTAAGLNAKTSDENGIVYWTWLVGGRTTPGNQRVLITGGGESFEFFITIYDTEN
ncbi:MAG: copper amine oxidase N-terminal domain-containing protein [Firmicutes bacterium]|nr:copper amine oxidase N-terminal domain-containing protein [Bacillota bacterium]